MFRPLGDWQWKWEEFEDVDASYHHVWLRARWSHEQNAPWSLHELTAHSAGNMALLVVWGTDPTCFQLEKHSECWICVPSFGVGHEPPMFSTDEGQQWARYTRAPQNCYKYASARQDSRRSSMSRLPTTLAKKLSMLLCLACLLVDALGPTSSGSSKKKICFRPYRLWEF